VSNVLYYGDNLEILRRHIPDESVDLVYLDPPFNSNRSYNILFKQKTGEESQAQIEAFDDTWTWSHEAEEHYQELVGGGTPLKVAEAVEAMRRLLGDNDIFAYLVMMTARLVELRRVLKPTGSLYLHCDPTASHYLKIMLDATFGPESFRNEIIWKRTSSHSSAKKYAPIHDVILYYCRSRAMTWNEPRKEYEEEYLDRYYKYDDGDGRLYWRNSLTAAGTRKGSSGLPWRGIDIAATGQHWKFKRDKLDELDAQGRIYWPPKGGFPQIKRYRDELKGLAVSDMWDDIDKINPVGGERLGYQTQKPIALLERIIKASSNESDIILDPFCGCGTTIDAAERLHRRWIGIDITYLAIDLIEKRLRHTYGDAITKTFRMVGIPHDVEGARALFNNSPFDFERWAVSMVDGQPQQHSQVADRGVDGVIRFPSDGKGGSERIIVSVKGGKQLGPQMVRDLRGTLENQRAVGGVLITLETPTRGMVDEANRSGLFLAERHGRSYPKVQIITVADLLGGKRPKLPPALLPYIAAQRRMRVHEESETLF
jgi:DNA modification methylase